MHSHPPAQLRIRRQPACAHIGRLDSSCNLRMRMAPSSPTAAPLPAPRRCSGRPSRSGPSARHSKSSSCRCGRWATWMRTCRRCATLGPTWNSTTSSSGAHPSPLPQRRFLLFIGVSVCVGGCVSAMVTLFCGVCSLHVFFALWFSLPDRSIKKNYFYGLLFFF